MRALIVGLSLCLVTASALAASPEVDSAIKVFKAVGANPDKLKTFCEMSVIMERMGEKEDEAAEAEIDRLASQLGADFERALEVSESVDEDSPDGLALSAALDELEDKCPQ